MAGDQNPRGEMGVSGAQMIMAGRPGTITAQHPNQSHSSILAQIRCPECGRYVSAGQTCCSDAVQTDWILKAEMYARIDRAVGELFVGGVVPNDPAHRTPGAEKTKEA